MNVTVDNKTCNGCGLCEKICPETFLLDKGKAMVGVMQIEPEYEFACHMIVRQCPTGAVAVGEARALMLAGERDQRRFWIAL
jgi:ferredoxin